MLEGEYRAMIADSLLVHAEEIDQPCYQVGIESQTYDFVNDNIVVYMIKGFPKFYIRAKEQK